eukprot:TRINITY_DN46528_c0_g1_i3.p1 TRINITY_DN46528_c0_g1~~TRINITY_DN46528_c0_g1_i3.p1  ORF type:complete len:272 (-),score=37.58 TRINITY_DN46528_c0_g1_i3:111-926(-)
MLAGPRQQEGLTVASAACSGRLSDSYSAWRSSCTRQYRRPASAGATIGGCESTGQLRSCAAVAKELTRLYTLMRRVQPASIPVAAPGRGSRSAVAKCPKPTHAARTLLEASVPRGPQSWGHSAGSYHVAKPANAQGRWDSSAFKDGKRDTFDFWRDLVMPFQVNEVTHVDTGWKQHEDGDVFTVAYTCAFGRLASRSGGMERSGATYENRIAGVAEVRMPLSYPAEDKWSFQLLSWGQPQVVKEYKNAWLSPTTGTGFHVEGQPVLLTNAG